MNRTFSSIVSLFLLLGALILTSCNKDKTNNFTIACLGDVEPFGYYDASGELTGFEVELIKAIAADQGLNIKLKPMPFEDILSELKNKKPKIDGAIAQITWTAARREFYTFSYSYLASGITVAVRSSDESVHSLGDLAGKTVACKSGTYISEYAQMQSETVGFTLKTFASVDEVFSALTSSVADAIMEEYPLIVYRAAKGMGIKVAYSGNLNQMLSLAIKTGAKSTLIESFDAGLQNLKSKGTYESILNKYFPSYLK